MLEFFAEEKEIGRVVEGDFERSGSKLRLRQLFFFCFRLVNRCVIQIMS